MEPCLIQVAPGMMIGLSAISNVTQADITNADGSVTHCTVITSGSNAYNIADSDNLLWNFLASKCAIPFYEY